MHTHSKARRASKKDLPAGRQGQMGSLSAFGGTPSSPTEIPPRYLHVFRHLQNTHYYD